MDDSRSVARGLGPATKVLHFCHITNLTGQIFPVKQICDEARRRGVKTIVDGAHAFAHFPYKASGARLRLLRDQPAQMAARADRHRVPLCPPGTHRVAVAADSRRPEAKADDIRKFEEIGTHPAANHNAIAEALSFHEGIGIERKAARLRYLRDRWAKRLARTRKCGSTPPGSGAVVRDRHGSDYRRADGKVVARLWDRWRIIATPIVHAEYEGVRVTPNVYTTLEEIDTFAAAMEEHRARRASEI